MARRDAPDLVVLDLMLPGMMGTDVRKELRKDGRTSQIPVLMLTAKGEEIDRVVGFEVGADDYLVKPFSMRELLLRIRAILRRCDSQSSSLVEGLISIGDIHRDRAPPRVERGERGGD